MAASAAASGSLSLSQKLDEKIVHHCPNQTRGNKLIHLVVVMVVVVAIEGR